jgi:hypothetical protein
MFLQTIQLDHDSPVDRLLIQPRFAAAAMHNRANDLLHGFPIPTQAIS